jgi:hypothetical protein
MPRDDQTVSIDPTGPVPPPDGQGRLILNEADSHFALAAFAAFIFSAVSLVSLLYWVIYLESGHTPDLTNPVCTAILRFGFLALPVMPFLFCELLSPPRLSITNAGVILRQRMGSKAIAWDDMVEINLQQSHIRSRHGKTSRTLCRLIGTNGARLTLEPIFGVSPAALANYLQTRGLAQMGATLPITQTPNPTMPQHVRVQLTMLGILAAFAVMVVLAAYGVMRHAPA